MFRKNHEHATRMDRICAMLNSPNTPEAEISRQIVLGMAEIVQEMTAMSPHHPLEPFYDELMKEMSQRLDAHRVLHRQLVESKKHSTRETLNLEGPKFTFLFNQLLKFFTQAMKAAGLAEPQQVMFQFKQLWASNLEQLRRNADAIGSETDYPPDSGN